MNFEIYTRNGCPYCDQVKMVLQRLDLNYNEKKLDSDFTREQFVEKFGYGSTFPRVFMNGQLLGGCNETVTYLRNQGLV